MSKAKRVALPTGITGQDRAYLTELLLEKVQLAWYRVTRQLHWV